MKSVLQPNPRSHKSDPDEKRRQIIKSNPPHTRVFSRDESSHLTGEKIESNTRSLNSSRTRASEIQILESQRALVAVCEVPLSFRSHGSYLGRCCILQTGIPPGPPRQDFSVSSTFAVRATVSTAEGTSAGSVDFNQQDTRRIQQSAGGEWRNASGSQPRSFRFLLRLSARCARKVTIRLAAAHLDGHAADLPSDARWTDTSLSQQMRDICCPSD